MAAAAFSLWLYCFAFCALAAEGGNLAAALGFINPVGLAARVHALHVQLELVALLRIRANFPAFTARRWRGARPYPQGANTDISVSQARVKPFCVPLQTAQREGTSVEDAEKSLTTANPPWAQWYRAC